jgi:hypothetical protein
MCHQWRWSFSERNSRPQTGSLDAAPTALSEQRAKREID